MMRGEEHDNTRGLRFTGKVGAEQQLYAISRTAFRPLGLCNNAMDEDAAMERNLLNNNGEDI